MPKAKSKKRTKRQARSPRHAKPTSHTPRPISLPLDVLRQIVRSASNDPDTLTKLARTSKDLHDMAIPMLYADVHLKSDEQVGRLLDDFQDDVICKAARMRGKVTRSGSKETLSSAQKAAITRLELLQSTTKMTFEYLPDWRMCERLQDTADKLHRPSLCANVSTMLFVSPLAEAIHRERNIRFKIDDLGGIASLARPTHICFRYTTVPSECNCISAFAASLMDHGLELQKVSVHAEAVDLRGHRISMCSEEYMEFEVFLADKTREACLPTHLSRFARENRPYDTCDNHAISIKIITPECDTDILKQEMEESGDDWIKNGVQVTARSKASPCEVCGLAEGDMQPSSEPDDKGMTITPVAAAPAITSDGQLHELSKLHSPAHATQADSTTPHTQTPLLTSGRVPQLPQEVLVMCFNNLHDDSDALARLTRTSKQFKEIYTPMLYGHRYFDDDDTLYYEELFPLAGVTERTPSRANDGGQQATEEPAGAQQQSSEPQIDDTAVEKDRVGRRRSELQQLTKSLTIRAFDATHSASLSDRIHRANLVGRPCMRGVDTLRLVENSNHDIHRLFGSNNSYEAVMFRSLLRNLVNPRHFFLEIIESDSERLGIQTRCSCYDMLVGSLYSRWSRLETITIHTTHFMLKQRRFISTPERVRLRIFVALVGGDIEHRLEMDRNKTGPIELIFEELDDAEVGAMQARMVKLVQDQSTSGIPVAELLEKGEDGGMKLRGVTLVAGKSSSACTICGGTSEEKGAYRGYETLEPVSAPSHTDGEIEPAKVAVIGGDKGGESAEEAQVVSSTGDQAGHVTTGLPGDEEQDKQTIDKDVPHGAAMESGQAELRHEPVAMDVGAEPTDEPTGMDGNPGGDGAGVVGGQAG